MVQSARRPIKFNRNGNAGRKPRGQAEEEAEAKAVTNSKDD